MNCKRAVSVLAVTVLLGVVTSPALSASIFFGPTPYTSAASIPAGFYIGAPTALEDFEDSFLDFGITASGGSIINQATSLGLVDSVDGDDGTIDGSGSTGHSWFFSDGPTGVTFTLPGLPTSAGIVWTDGWGTTTFEAFGPGMVSLGIIGPVALADDFITGETAEDRFFGVQDSGGILAIKLSNTEAAIEVDHVQFGSAVPVPPAVYLFVSGLLGLIGIARRRKAA